MDSHFPSVSDKTDCYSREGGNPDFSAQFCKKF